MTQPMHIVVGIELDETGNVAYRSAAALARATNATLHLCHSAGPIEEGAASAEQRLEHGQKALGSWAATHLSGDPLLSRIQFYVDLGPPADVLRRLAADTGAAMIIVGSHGKGALARLTQGSVVHDLMQKSPCPVTIATEYDHESFKVSPAVEAPPAPGQAKPNVERPHRLRYRRSVSVTPSQSTVGPAASMGR